jgi:uncharacterized repeat protein (TIGR03803 family)
MTELKLRVGHVLAIAVFMVSMVGSSAESSATLTALVSFDGTNGYLPQGGLVQDDQGNFYGTLSYGGWFDDGTVYRVSMDGTCVILVTFDGNNGSHPVGLIRGADGNFYGTTLEGGPEGSGSVFRMTPDGAITTLATFCAYSTGFSPLSLFQGQDGNFYGITHRGGAHTYGTVFKMTPDGNLTTVFAFDKTNGAYPTVLLQGKDGNLYGTTSEGTPGLNGSTFKLTCDGKISIPATNDVLDGNGHLKGEDGNFYGIKSWGRVAGTQQFSPGGVFKISPDGVRTTLVQFDQTNGASPLGQLVQGHDGNLYGVASRGGAFNQGTVFRVNLNPLSAQLSAASPKVNVPILLHAISNRVDPLLMDLMQAPIDFYGKVVDENSNVVALAKVAFRWMDLTARGLENTSAGGSDAMGLFSLAGKQGASLTVSVSKDGYYATRNSQQTFRYSKMEGNLRIVPDARHPVIFELRKQGKGEHLIVTSIPPGIGQIFQLWHDGTPIEIDLLNGTKAAPGSGQLKLEFWRDISEKNIQPFDWKLILSVPGGGIRQTEEEFAFMAPSSGYQSSLIIDMPKTNKSWQAEIRSKYYVQLPGGKYGRIDFYLMPYNGAFTINSVINSSGSRNLEPIH